MGVRSLALMSQSSLPCNRCHGDHRRSPPLPTATRTHPHLAPRHPPPLTNKALSLAIVGKCVAASGFLCKAGLLYSVCVCVCVVGCVCQVSLWSPGARPPPPTRSSQTRGR